MAASVAAPGGAETGSTVLTNAAQVHALSRQEAALGQPVRVAGVVTFFEPAWGILFIQDASGGVFVTPPPGLKTSVGKVVEATGTTDTGGVMPIVINTVVRTVGEAPLPEPRRLVPPVAALHSWDCEWAELEGVVRAALPVEPIQPADHFRLELEAQGHRWNVLVGTTPAEASEYAGLVDARIVVRGVAGVDLDTGGQVASTKLFVPRRDLFRVLTPPPPDPFGRPLRPIAQIQEEKLASLPEHRVRLLGVVTHVAAEGVFVVEDATGAIRVRCPEGVKVAPDQSVEVAGFVTPGLFSHALEGAVVRTSAAPALTPPPLTAAASMLYGRRDGRLARLDATVQAVMAQSNGLVLTLHQNGIFFRALAGFPSATNLLSRVTPGALVRLTGVCALQGQHRDEPQSFQILLRSERDVEPLPTPPVFSLRQVLALLGGSLLVVAAGVVWVLTLRARVKQQTQVIRERLEHEAALEQRYRHLLEGASFPLVICSLEQGTLLYLNQRAQARLRLPPTATGSLEVSGLFAQPQDWEALRAQLSLKPLSGEVELRLKPVEGQSFWGLISASVIEFDRQPAAFISLNDISDRKAAEAERERLIQELRDALARVKTLNGLLPICAACKKIRNDQGYWASVETYIQERSDAQFTHGLCPDCIPRYFPDTPGEEPTAPKASADWRFGP
jgi:PAS domain-containing protein